jgi:hypothetical protein
MRWILLLVLALAACSKGPEADLPSIGEARSLGAEWAMVNEQAAQGHLTAPYVETMRKELRQQLQSSRRSMTQPESAYGRETDALLREPDDASPEELRAHVAKLKKIEDSVEST